MASEVDETQVQAVHCFAATFRHPTTNDARSGILRVNSFNQSIELFTIEGLVLSINASNIICFQFDVRNPETQFTIYRRSQIPVDIQTASSEDSDQICVLLDALIANRPIAPNCKFLRSGQADLCGRTVTLILLGNAHIVFAEGSTPILLINLAHTKISLSRKTGITLTLLKGPEQDYLLDMKSERERQEWVVAFNRAMAIRKSPPGVRLSVAQQHRAAGSLASPGGIITQQRGSFATSSTNSLLNINKGPIVDYEQIHAANLDPYQEPSSNKAFRNASAGDKHDSLVRDDEVQDKQNKHKSVLSRDLSFKRPSLNQNIPSQSISQRSSVSKSITRIIPRSDSISSITNSNNMSSNNGNITTATSNNNNTGGNHTNNSNDNNTTSNSANNNNNNDGNYNGNNNDNNNYVDMKRNKNHAKNNNDSSNNNSNVKATNKPVVISTKGDNKSTTTNIGSDNDDNSKISKQNNVPKDNQNDISRKTIGNTDNQTRPVSNARRESFSRQIEMEPEPEPLRSPSFVAPISVQMKSIRSSYAAARSLVSATSMKRMPTAGSEAVPYQKTAKDASKAEDLAASKSLQLEEKVLEQSPKLRSKEPSMTMKPGRVPCIIVSIESNGTLRQMTSAANILQVTARCAEAAAIAVDGAILQWSFSDDGSYTGPVVIPHPDGVQFEILSCGRDHHLAVSSPPSSQIYGWGRCSLLGMKGSIKTVTSTTPIPALAEVCIKAVASAAKHTFAVSTLDEIWTWGGAGPWLGRDQSRHHFTPTVLTTRLSTPVLQVACSTESSYVVTTNGRVYACGSGRHGRLGLGDCLDRAELSEIMIPAEITDVVPGGRHALAQSKSGQIYAWGCNAHGQLGISASVKMSMSPVLVPALTSCAVVKIACAKTATMALTRSADVLMCGSLTGGQVLDSPTILELDPTVCGRVHDIVCGYNIALIMSEPPASANSVPL